MNKFAILLECDPGNTLGGSCLRDIDNMASHLIDMCQFLPQNINLLTTSSYRPKTQGVQQSNSKEIFKVVESINQSNPQLIVVLLSGHGFSVGDRNGDELDGCDEAINVGFQILDDDLYNLVLKMKCDVIFLADTCHSGTMFDLPYCYDVETDKFVKSSNRNDTMNHRMISLSACADQQLSMCDVGDLTGFGGSLTTALLNIDNVMQELLSRSNFKNLYNKLQARLGLLNQKLILSSSKQ